MRSNSVTEFVRDKEMENIIFTPIGIVKNSVKSRKDASWGDDDSLIILDKQYACGLNGLENFSHAIILFYLDKAKYEKEKHLQRRPQNRDDMPLVGIFSQRGKLLHAMDRLHQRYDFQKIQEVLGYETESGLKILEENR